MSNAYDPNPFSGAPEGSGANTEAPTGGSPSSTATSTSSPPTSTSSANSTTGGGTKSAASSVPWGKALLALGAVAAAYFVGKTFFGGTR